MLAECAGGRRGVRGGRCWLYGQGGRGSLRRAPPAPVLQRVPRRRAGGHSSEGWAQCPRTASGSSCPRWCKAMKVTRYACLGSPRRSAHDRQHGQTAGQGAAGWTDSGQEAVGLKEFCRFLCLVYRSDWRVVHGIGDNILDCSRLLPLL